MTLALTGKSRRRQAALLVAAFLALCGAVVSGIAARDAESANADGVHYQAVFSLADMAGGDTTLREWELARAELTLTINEELAGEGLILEMDVPDQVQASGYQKFGLMSSLDCSISIVGFTCLSPDGAAEGLYRLQFLVRHRTAACESGPFTLTTTISHPDDQGSPRAFETNTLTFDCSLPPLLDPEVSIDIQMFSGFPPGAVPFPTTVAEPSGPAYDLYPSFGYPRSFTTTPGSTYLTVAPPGGIKVVGVTCTGLGSFQRTGNELRLTLEHGEAADCSFLVRAPIIQVQACFEGPLGQHPTGARWGFSSENVDADTPILENRITYFDPDYPDEPGPFDLDDFIAHEGDGWQWSAPVPWDIDREGWMEWRLGYSIGTLSGVFIDEPEEEIVTPYNLCPGAPVSVSFTVCSHFLDSSGDPLDTFDFTYVVNGELAAEIPVREGQDPCEVVPMGVNDLDTVINLSQLTEPGWEHGAGYPKRKITFFPDPTPPGLTGSAIAFKFFWNDSSDVLGCHEVGQQPVTDAPCTIVFQNARPSETDPEPIEVSLTICQENTDTTDVDLPAVFTYKVKGQPAGGIVDSNGGQHSCFSRYLTLPNLIDPILVEQVTPATWQNAPGYPQRRVIHYQDNPQANRPGDSVLVQYAPGKGGGIVCYEPGIVGLLPAGAVGGTGLACHVVFENVRMEPDETPTPTPTQPTPTATPTEDPSQAPTQPVEQASPTVSPTGTSDDPAATATTADPGTAVPTAAGDPTATATAPTSGQGGGDSVPPAPEETVAGERTAPAGITPIAPSTGDTGEFAGQPASIWAVLACFLFAASMAFTVAALWKQK